LWASRYRELAQHVVELGDERRKVGLVHDVVQLEVEMDLPEDLAAALWAGLALESYVAQCVELKRQSEPWLHRLKGRFLPGSVVQLPRLVPEPRELIGTQAGTVGGSPGWNGHHHHGADPVAIPVIVRLRVHPAQYPNSNVVATTRSNRHLGHTFSVARSKSVRRAPTVSKFEYRPPTLHKGLAGQSPCE